MVRAIHLINKRDGAALHGMTSWPGEPQGFRSCCWRITDDEAASLTGGWVYFHETKRTVSRFGGRIVAFEAGVDDMAQRKVILFRADPAGREQKWRGASHAMAMWSGVVDADLSHETV